uniref:Si:ch211-106h11.1 n=1 Tax=Cynoglossus semilaevis TaxID=244447 RepID=A0A3P8W9G1_CYNSE
MFTLTELAPVSPHQSRSKLLKPWWEVFMDHLGVLMLMTSVLTCTVQLSRDTVVCVPSDTLVSDNNHSFSKGDSVALSPRKPTHTSNRVEAEGRRPHLVYQQYVYVSQVCYHQALPASSRFFPYLALLQSLVLLAVGSFWLHLPHTSARVEHFLTILAKCCESPWTSQVLCHAAHSPPRPSSRSSTSTVWSTSLHPRAWPPGSRKMISLEKSDGEETRALLERVRKFRAHCEGSSVIHQVYVSQTVLKLLLVTVILGYTAPLVNQLTFTHTCRPEEQALVAYGSFECVHVFSSLLHKLLATYVTLLGFYGLFNVYALGWISHSSLQQYSLRSLRDVPDLRNDLAFLCHMLDHYSPLLLQRLSVFLSPLSESGLPEETFEQRWSQERLRAMSRVDAGGCSRLQLVGLPHLPPALFTLNQLQVLELELMKQARELHLVHCTAAADPSVLGVLRERLEVLHLTFARPSQIPSWVLSLHSLHQLHLTGRLGGEGGVGRSWAVGSLRQLHHLRVLVVRGMLPRIPGELCHVAGSLVRLEIHNEGVRLLVLTALKRMVGLTELLLQDCRLERLPSALLSLTRLQTLDLQHNSLTTLEELLSLAHLQHLSCLRLAYNHVRVLPPTVGVLRGLEILDLSNNQIHSLPPALFTLRHLRRLLLAGNLVEELPPQIKALRLLSELDLSGNRLEKLPSELFSCLGLRTLNVAHNSLRSLPGAISALGQLCRLDLRTNSLEGLMESILFEPTVLNTGYLLPLAVGRGIFLLAVY